MTSCAACGDCCEVIGVNNNKSSIDWVLGHYPETHDDPAFENSRFIAAHWHEIPIEAAAAINLTLVERDPWRTFFVCDQWNPATRLCMAQDTKPPVCRDFPWYGDGPNNYRLTGFKRCSFWADVPREEWPDGTDPLPSPEPINCC